MRNIWFALLVALGGPALCQAQTPPMTVAPPITAPTLDPQKVPLDKYLLRWHEEMGKVQTLALRCTRDDISKIHNTKDTFEGTIHFMKPNYIILQLTKKGKPEQFEKIICTGNNLFQFVPGAKEIRQYQALGAKPGEDDNALSFLFGMKPEDIKKRYDLTLAKEDNNYIYIDVAPKMKEDKAEFSKARIVLNKDNFLPRQIWFQQPNTEEVLWDIPTIQSGVKLEKKDFAVPQVPQGWKMVQGLAPQNDPPRVVRPQEK